MSRKNKSNNKEWVMTRPVYDMICQTLGTRRPEWGGILGSSDGIHIDHYYFDETAKRSSGTYTMDTKALNRVIHQWNDNGVNLIGIIHSLPQGVTQPSMGDMETAKHIIESINVRGEFFTPIVQVSPELNGNIEIYPYTFKQVVKMYDQPFSIEEAVEDEVSEIVELDNKAPRRFARITSIFPHNLMFKKKIIVVGCGGAIDFVEALARCGAGHFVLVDGDTVEDTNIATQGTYISEIGKTKTSVVRDRIHNINPLAKVVCVNKYLDDTISDAEFSYLTGIIKSNAEDTLLCGCTDSDIAQIRCELLSLKFGIPYLAAQVYAGGKGNEVIFTYPGLTTSCPMCMLGSRYKKVFSNPDSLPGTSEGTAVWVTNYLNVVKSYLALCILCYNEKDTPYYHTLDDYADRNYFMSKCDDDLQAPAIDPINKLALQEEDLSFPLVTVAIGQTPEENCPVCGGSGKLEDMKNMIADTRALLHDKIAEMQKEDK